MTKRASRAARPIVALLLAWPAWAGPPTRAASETRRYAGRALIEALDDLRARGLSLIYSSDLVRPDMIVSFEPAAGAPRRVLDRLLEPFDLRSQEGPGGTVLIVRSAPAGRDDGRTDGRSARSPAFREEVKVNSTAPEGIADRPESRKTLGPEQIRQVSQIGDDPNRIVARLPGVAAGDKSAAFEIRGGGVDETLFILDGLEIDDPYHLRDFLRFSSIIDSKALESLDLLSGVFPAEYGGRMSGVVDLSSRLPAGPPRTNLGVGSVNSSLLSEGTSGSGDAGWLLSTRAWRPDALVDIVDPGGEGLNPSYYDLLGKVEVSLGGGTILSGHVLAARDYVDAQTETEEGSVTATSGSHYAWLNLKTAWTGRLYSRTVVSLGRANRRRDGGFSEASGGSARVRDDRSFASDALGQDWLFRGSDRASLSWGYGVKRIAAAYDYSSHVESIDPLFTGGLPVIIDRNLRPRPSGTDFGAYVSGRFHPSRSLGVELGGRWDRQTVMAENEVSPRVTIVFAPGSRSALRLGWGLFHQPQDPEELQVEDGLRELFPSERAELRSINFDHAFSGGLSLGIGAYSRQMTHLHPRYENIFDPMVVFSEARSDRLPVAAARARAEGVELTLSMERGRAFDWWAGYALARADDEIDGRLVPRSWDQRHTLNLVVRYRRGQAWDVTLAGQYHSGRPTTDVRAEDVVNADGSLSIRPVLGPRNAGRFPPFHRLDLEVRRRFVLGHGTLGLFLEVTNLYGRDNVCCVRELRYLPRPDGTVRVERVEGFWLRPLPVFGLTWEFGP